MNQLSKMTATYKITARPGRFCGLLLSLSILLAARQNLFAQVSSAASACRLSGTDSVSAGATASFTLGPCTATGWKVSCGTIAAQSANTVTINFTTGSCVTATITATGTSATSKTVTILPAQAFSAGVVAQITRTITYNKIPVTLLIPPASGGLCGGVYTYQWLSSTDSNHFTAIPGAINQNFQPGPLTATTYFKRQSTCPVSGTVTSNVITVTVSPSLTGAALNLPVQNVNYDSSPATLSVILPAGSATTGYQWQSAGDGSFTGAQNIAGANSNTFMPGPLTSTTCYRVVLVSPGDSAYSSPAVIRVYPALMGGNLIPATQTVTYDSLPELLTCTGFSGGTGEYSFFWYSSPDGNSWSPVAGVSSAGYNPGMLSATTWFRVLVTSNGVAVASASAVINVTTQH